MAHQMRCGTCGTAKPLDAFSPSIIAQGHGRCRDCARNAQRADRKRDPERFRAYRKDFVARSPDSARASYRKWEAKKKAQHLERPPIDGSIRCSTCREIKPLAAFIPSVVARGSGMCRACKQLAKRDYVERNREKTNAAARARIVRGGESFRVARRARQLAHYRDNPETYRRYNLSRYGLTLEQYDVLLASQGGGCACCGAKANPSGKRLFVDHDHETGAVRGILCNACNRGIGSLGDTIDGLRRALAYLENPPAQVQAAPPPAQAPALRVNLLRAAN